ncbi:MAG TPA: helix-hairpin-helix domain-containing protein [Anaeromyxobacteraceae bacterium]|nr:helix-hairpin-helix domain-containing protein [Anaeromyxobacteraceae bacterium]
MSARGAALVLGAALLAASPALAAKRALPPGQKIDLNRAGVVELMRLPGVGQKRAQAIVAQRARQPFRKLEDVLTVKGLGPAWLARVKANVVVSGGGGATPAPVAAAARR